MENFTIHGHSGTEAEQYANDNGFTFDELPPYSGTSGDCTWSYDAGTGTLTVEGSGKMANYSGNAPWTAYRTSIKKVVIGNGVTYIGDNAFYFCRHLTEVKLCDSLETIGVYAFGYCDLRSVVIPDATKLIQLGAFLENRNLASVTFGEQLREIGVGAFEQTALTSVEFNDQLAKIYYNAFLNCNIGEVTIPGSVTLIGENALGFDQENTDSELIPVEGFTISGYTGSEAERYANDNGFAFTSLGVAPPNGITGDCIWELDLETGVLTVSGEGEMTDYIWDQVNQKTSAPWWYYRESITSVIIGDGVLSVGEESFEDCNNLTALTLGENVKAINDYAFAYCDLKTLVIPDSVETIGYCAFVENYNLKKVILGSGLQFIDEDAFLNCGLTEVTIPENVTDIGEKAFGYNEVINGSEWQYIPVENFTIRGKFGTEAECYAMENGFVFKEAIDYIGDANRDGKINIKDVTAIQRHVAEYELLTGEELIAADVNGDGVVTIEDATILQRYLAEFDVALG